MHREQPEAAIPIPDGWRDYKRPAGSKTTASYYMELKGTRESQSVSLAVGNTYKPVDGKRCYDALAVGLTYSIDEAE